MPGSALILLVGEQPLPNLLPARHLHPDALVLVCTERTRPIAERLKTVLSDSRCSLHEIADPYDIPAIQNDIDQIIQKLLPDFSPVINLTGGTKPMALGAFLVASQCRIPFVYLETERGNILYHHEFMANGEIIQRKEVLSTTITLEDYLRAQVGGYTAGPPRHPFEAQVCEILKSIQDLEVLTSVRPQEQPALEVDFIIRLGNRIGVIECKHQADKRGIDQIQAVTEQRYLGTYVDKFLVSAKPVDSNNVELAKAYRIEVVELPSCADVGSISDEDRKKLIELITARLRR